MRKVLGPGDRIANGRNALDPSSAKVKRKKKKKGSRQFPSLENVWTT